VVSQKFDGQISNCKLVMNRESEGGVRVWGVYTPFSFDEENSSRTVKETAVYFPSCAVRKSQDGQHC
jgi:hypothetical protein